MSWIMAGYCWNTSCLNYAKLAVSRIVNGNWSCSECGYEVYKTIPHKRLKDFNLDAKILDI